MKDSLRDKLAATCRRLREIDALLATGEVGADLDRFRDLSRERAGILPVATLMDEYLSAENDRETARGLISEDPEFARQEMALAEARIERAERELRLLLLPHDPDDEHNVFLEIRAGTGGDESALFAADLLRMYLRYAERQGWRAEIVSRSESELGGYREVICRVSGATVYARLKFESGVHRVQRVPRTEAQGRIHTSACTVAVLPEPDQEQRVNIDPADLRIDVFRASGAGGQHVQKTDSAVRVTHLPTGLVVECQDERSQHQNKERALAVLAARLSAAERERQRAEQASQRRLMVGSGDRSERIRTYNFPQGRVTDHRVGLTLYRLEAILDGDLDEIVSALRAEEQARLLAQYGGEGE